MAAKIEVRVTKFDKPNGKTVGLATATIAETIVVKGIQIVNGANGLFISMPQRKLSKPAADGKEYEDVAFPASADARAALQAAVLDAYNAK